MGEKISVEELFHLFSLSTVCLANLSYSLQATSELPTTPCTMKNCEPFCRGKISSQIAALENTAQVKTEKKIVIKNINLTWKGRKLWKHFVGKKHWKIIFLWAWCVSKVIWRVVGFFLPVYFIMSQFWFSAAGSRFAITSTLADPFT